MSSIGRDILSYSPPKGGVFFSGPVEYRERVLNVLQNSQRPLTIIEVQKGTGLRCWITVKSILMELVISGKAEVFKTGTLLLFRLPQSKEGPI
jgi:hypothetical protein